MKRDTREKAYFLFLSKKTVWCSGPNDFGCDQKQIVLVLVTLARTDLLYMLNWGTQWTMVSQLEK